MRKIDYKVWKTEESGATAVIVALSMTVLLLCAALVVDLGGSYLRKVELQTAVDNAVAAGGQLLPVKSGSSDQQELINLVMNVLDQNGFNQSNVNVEFEWDTNGSSSINQVRVNATSTVDYFFAGVLGRQSGDVFATAVASIHPIGSTSHASAIYITKVDFERQVPTLSPMTPITITISSSGSTTSNFAKTGLINLPAGEGAVLSVGDTRRIENSANVYSTFHASIQSRIDECASTCGPNCTATSHSSDCPRIAVLPVVIAGNAEDDDRPGAMARSDATVQYFVAVYIDSIHVSGKTGTITMYFLDDYREESTVDLNPTYEMNPFIVCTPLLGE